VNLDSISDRTVTVIHEGNVLETLALTKAYEEVHEGAVLLHQGETYISEELNLKSLTAKVRKEDVNYHTEAKKTVDVSVKKVLEEKQDAGKVGIGELDITEIYHEFLVKTYDETIGRHLLDLPPLTFPTVGMWFTIPDDIKDEIENRELDFEGGLHAVEHAMIAMSPIYAMCDRWDIGGLSTKMHPEHGRPYNLHL